MSSKFNKTESFPFKKNDILLKNGNSKYNQSNNNDDRDIIGENLDEQYDDKNENQNDVNNIIRLNLKKPKLWNWELTTSKSSPNIAFPKIKLYDDKGILLAKADKANTVLKSSLNNLTNNNSKETPLNINKNSLKKNSYENIKDNKLNNSCIHSVNDDCFNDYYDDGKLSQHDHVRSKSLHEHQKRKKDTIKAKRSLSTNIIDCKNVTNKNFLNEIVEHVEKNGIDYLIRHHHDSPIKFDNNNLIIKDIDYNNDNDDDCTTGTSSSFSSKIRNHNNLSRLSIENSNKETLNAKKNIENCKEFKEIMGRIYKRSVSSNLDELLKQKTIPHIDDFKEINKKISNGKMTTTTASPPVILTEHRRNFMIKKSKSALEIPNNKNDNHQTILPKTTTTTITTTTTTTTNNDKRKYRRAQSINSMRFSTSILERISEFKSRTSSSSSEENITQKDDEIFLYKNKRKTKMNNNKTNLQKQNELEGENENIDENLIVTKPKYTLRTSNIGTLIVCEESFRKRKIRRRSRSCSKIPDSDETQYLYKNEKIKKEFEYVGNEMLLRPSSSSSSSMLTSPTSLKTLKIDKKNKVLRIEENKDNKFDTYDTAISNIDKLIKNLSIKKERETTFENNTRKGIDSDNSCNNYCLYPDKCNRSVQSSNERKNYNDNVHSWHSSKSFNEMDKKKQKQQQNELNYLKQKKTKNKSIKDVCGVSVGVGKDNVSKIEQNKFLRKRSSSAGTYFISSSSSDNDEHVGGFNGRRRKLRGRRQLKNPDGKKADQTTVAIKSLIVPSSTNIDSSSRLLGNNSDEVLLRLVHRLASLQQQQQQQHQHHHHYSHQDNQQIQQLLNKNDKINRKLNKNIKKLLETNNKSHDEIDNLINLNSSSNNNNKLVLAEFIKDKENLSQIIDKKDNNMGSNVSRNTGKGLSGRRTQSSGNLCNGKHSQSETATISTTTKTTATNSKDTTTTTTSNAFVVSGRGASARYYIKGGKNDNSITDNSLIKMNKTETCKLMNVCKKDRNKFCGSLPNHLDSDDVCDNEFQHQQNLYKENVEYVTVGPKKHHPNLEQQLQLQQLQLQQQQKQQQHSHNSPYNNSSSGKGSITSSTNLGSTTFKTNHDIRPELQLKIPINRTNLDAGCDQGYGSERSPEDEIPPPLPLLCEGHYDGYLSTMEMPFTNFNWDLATNEYNFITKDCTFSVKIIKGPRGLGLSVSGGSDSNAAFPGLIRIKRLFPHQSAWSTGMLQPGDILLEANGIPLTGLTNYEALEVLRTTPNNVMLIVCRPRDERYRKLSPPTEPPKPPQRTSIQNLPLIPLEPLSPIQTNYTGEFEILMTKQQGSLGFTLRKEDESVLGHYVRALIRDPALNDGRIKPGDKIVAVNDIPLSPMTHEEAVIFLRQAADTVKLRFYRDEAQTPVAALSPTNPENKSFCNTLRTKTHLRPEAINLLSDLAYRKQTPCDSTGSSLRSSTTSPRRLRRVKPQSGNTSQSDIEMTESRGSNPKYIISTQTSCSDSDTSTFSQCSFLVQPATPSEIYTSDEGGVSGTVNNNGACKLTDPIEYYEEDELFQMVDELDDRPDRPKYLDLVGESGSTPGSSRKPRFQFTVAANSYELNNLDNDALDAPIYTGKNINNNTNKNNINNNNHPDDDFNSLPCETFLVACMTESDLNNAQYHQQQQQKQQNFNHKNPIYQSAVIQYNKDALLCEDINKDNGGTKSLLKWKGVMFSPDEEEKETPGVDDSSCAATVGTNPTPGTDRDLDFNGFTTDTEGHKIIAVELNRGWNSRLGFSLQTDPNTKHPIISAIYNDSVTAKDGRLKVGDQLFMVNDEIVEHMTTAEIIDLLRIIRGSICIAVLRADEK